MPHNDEWNRLEKLYKMRQEEQRKIEMANFQRLLAQADALTKSMQALGYRTPLPWEQKNRFDGTENSEIERASESEFNKMNIFDYIDDVLNGAVMSGIHAAGNAIGAFAGEAVASPVLDTGVDAASLVVSPLEASLWAIAKKPRYRQGGTAQRTFLMPRDQQRKIFINEGYLIGRDYDYGPLAKTAERHANREMYKHEDGTYDPLPVYQTAPDAVDPSKLLAMPSYYRGNNDSPIYSTKEDLVHAGNYPVKFYIDPTTEIMYKKAWDINDYGGDDGGASSAYGSFAKKAANYLDSMGNPVVVTTGFQPIMADDGVTPLHLDDIRNWENQTDPSKSSRKFRNLDEYPEYHGDPNWFKKFLREWRNYGRPGAKPITMEPALPLPEITVYGDASKKKY